MRSKVVQKPKFSLKTYSTHVCLAELDKLTSKLVMVSVVHSIFTARVRSTYDGKLCFHRCVSVQLLGGGRYPMPGLDGGWYPIPCLDGRGYPIPGLDGGWWYPIPGLDGGGGIPHPRSGWLGVPRPGLDGGSGGYPGQVFMVR